MVRPASTTAGPRWRGPLGSRADEEGGTGRECGIGRGGVSAAAQVGALLMPAGGQAGREAG